MNMLLATTYQQVFGQLAALMIGTSVAWFAFAMLQVMYRCRSSEDQSQRIESGRRLKVSRGSRIFEKFEPLIDEIVDLRFLHTIGRISRVRKDLRAGGETVPFTAEEFLAIHAVRGMLIGGSISLVMMVFGSGIAMSSIFGLIVTFGSFIRSTRRLHLRAEHRKARFMRRLPYAVDLMALMMEAGARFRDSLSTIVRESKGHPIGEEFGIVLSEIEHGQTLKQSLSNLRDRLADNDLNEMIFAIHKAEELGTPLSKIFLTQAEQMRLKRSQRAEKLAGQANANISFPGLVVMLACILLVMAPFVLNAINQATISY